MSAHTRFINKPKLGTGSELNCSSEKQKSAALCAQRDSVKLNRIRDNKCINKKKKKREEL